jgi:hypothetical protein
LGVNIDAKGKINKSACSTEFKPVNRFNSGLVAQAHQMPGGPSPKAPLTKIDQKTKDEATKGIDKGSKSDAELKAEADAKAARKAKGQSLTGGNTITRAEIGRYIDAGYRQDQIEAIQAAVGDTPYSDQGGPGFRRTVSSTGEVNSSK